MNELREVMVKAIEELRNEGMNPDIVLAGSGFIEHAREFIARLGLRVYRIEELGYDAVIADSKFLGQIKKASRRISVEPFLEEKNVWEEIEKLDV
ncbi:family 4B encapsulin nanocompartment shell protein [Thermococcus sp.]